MHDQNNVSEDRAANTPQRLLTFSSGGWVLLLAGLLTLISAGIVLWPVWQTGFRSAVGDGQHVETYGFDLSACAVPREELIASGKAKDGVRAVPESLVETLSVAEVELAKENERTPFLLGVDPVIGVSFGGEARAYPTRIMNLHEVVNDRVGGQAVVVTWDPVCGSAVVFSRIVGNDSPMEFGVSGLLYNSNLLMFDRHSTDAKMESLWSQLGFAAIAGPAAGKKLTVLPFELTTWEAWVAKHPNARAFEGLRTLKTTYRDVQYPFEMYLSTDQIPFPVTPLWADHSLKLKTPIVATSRDGAHWLVKKDAKGGMAAALQGDERRVYAFLFAWYAQHSGDTDYGGIVEQTGNH